MVLSDEEKICEWTRQADYDDETWSTDCGKEFVLFDEATPKECEFNYCAFCGKTLKERLISIDEG